MSVAKTTYYEFKGKTGIKWKVSIIDTASSASTTATVNPTSDGFVMDWQGDLDTGYTPIMSSQMTFSLYLDSVVRELIAAILAAPENTYVVQVQKFVTSTYIRQWTGFIVRDELILPDVGVADNVEVVEFTAVDGFGLLQDVEYTGFTPGSLTRVTITDFICDQVLAVMPAGKLALSTAVLGQASVWYDDHHPSSDSDDPLYRTYVNESAFVEVDEYGVTKGLPLLDCFRHILNTFLLEMRQWNGVYLLIQQNTFTQATTRVWYYALDGTYNSTALIDLQEDMFARMPGGSFQYLLPAKQVSTIYNYKQGIYDNNLLPYNVDENTEYSLGSSQQGYDFAVSGTIETHYTGTGTGDAERIVIAYKLVIKNGTYYLNQNSDDELEWLEDNSVYVPIRTRVLKSILAAEQVALTSFAFITQLPTEGEAITFEWTFWRIEDANESLWTPPGGSTQTMTHDDREGTFKAYIQDDVQMEGGVYYKATVNNSAVADIELEESVLGDGYHKFSAGALWIKDTTDTVVPSDKWLTYSEIPGTGIEVHSLRCREMIANRRNIVILYEGSFFGNPDIQKGFKWDEKYWIWLSVNWTANMSEFSGTAMRVDPTLTDITIGTPLPSQEDNGSSSGGSGSTVFTNNNDQYWQRNSTTLSPLTAGDNVSTTGKHISTGTNQSNELHSYGFETRARTNDPVWNSYREGAGTNNGVQSSNNVGKIRQFAKDSSGNDNQVMIDATTATETHTSTAHGVQRVISTSRNGSVALKARISITGDGEVIINDDGEPTATRIEGDTDSNLVNVDAVNDRVGISGDGTVDTKLHITTPSNWGMESVKIEQQDEDKAFIDFKGTSSSGTDKNISTLVGDGGMVVGPYSAGVGGFGWEFVGMFKIELNGTEYWSPFYINTAE